MAKPAPTKQGVFSSIIGLFSPKSADLTKKDNISGKTINFIDKLQKEQEVFASKAKQSN
jgi:DNA-binding ferritin-like protein (Dps family)